MLPDKNHEYSDRTPIVVAYHIYIEREGLKWKYFSAHLYQAQIDNSRSSQMNVCRFDVNSAPLCLLHDDNPFKRGFVVMRLNSRSCVDWFPYLENVIWFNLSVEFQMLTVLAVLFHALRKKWVSMVCTSGFEGIDNI